MQFVVPSCIPCSEIEATFTMNRLVIVLTRAAPALQYHFLFFFFF